VEGFGKGVRHALGELVRTEPTRWVIPVLQVGEGTERHTQPHSNITSIQAIAISHGEGGMLEDLSVLLA
jgi:hypothetical protein